MQTFTRCPPSRSRVTLDSMPRRSEPASKGTVIGRADPRAPAAAYIRSGQGHARISQLQTRPDRPGTAPRRLRAAAAHHRGGGGWTVARPESQSDRPRSALLLHILAGTDLSGRRHRTRATAVVGGVDDV